MRRISAYIAAALVIAAPAAAASARAKLKITDATPMTIRGTAFHRHERVRITVQQPKAISTRRVRATVAGTFVASFPNVKVRRCQAWSVTAVGSRGSHATLVRRP